MLLNEIQEYVSDFGVPFQDDYSLSTSSKSFPDGAHFRTEELPLTIDEYELLFTAAQSQDLVVNRITDVSGIMFNSDKEIIRKLEIARDHGAEVIMGPGASEQRYDISQQAEIHALVEGKVRGMDQLVLTVQSMLRGAELGCRGFLMYDEGVLTVALKMRKDGLLPADTKFKISANISISNALSIKFWFDMMEAQDAINPIRDLTLPMLAAMRQVVDNPLDMHMYHKTSIARIMEASEIVRVGAPLYLKNARFGPGISAEDRIQYCHTLVEAIKHQAPELIQSGANAVDMAIPAEPGSTW